MTWADFYLICFALGFAFSLLSYLLGGLHWHLPHGWGGPHVHAGHGAGHGAGHAGEVSFFNPVTLAAFLAWFGGMGYLLTRFSTVWLTLGLMLALASGLLGAGIVFLFLSRVLTSEEENLDSADFDMVGVLGKLSMPIREGGTGEMIYSQAGTRRSCGARAEDGSAIAKGTEVVVTRYEKGIAYVRLWTEMAGEEPASEAGKASS
ncbi:MAG: NfeD family protein [Acidobacteriia bacterium]|nr:NfeD family protein [Terriglobia bacterium]